MTTWTESMDGTKPVVHLGPDTFWESGLDEAMPQGDGGVIVFQHGPIKEVGVNGTTIETVITALINRLEGFQRGPFSNDYNANAIKFLEMAKESLENRTRDRQARSVEGTNQA